MPVAGHSLQRDALGPFWLFDDLHDIQEKQPVVELPYPHKSWHTDLLLIWAEAQYSLSDT